MRSRIHVLTLVATLFAAAGLTAQEREIEASGLPQAMIDRLIRVVHDPATVHFRGPTAIPGDSVIPGSVVVQGPLVLAGHVHGDVIVVGGDVELEWGYEIGGDLTVVDGEIRGDEHGRVGGLLAQASRAVARGVPGTRVTRDEPGVSVRVSRDAHRGASSHFALRAGDYNRVEGLQVLAGPILTTGGENPFRTTALVVWRSEGEAVPTGVGRTGYRVEAEQFVGGRRELRVGGGVHSVVAPVEGWGLTDRENAWSSFLLSTDHRDHYERRGWSAFVRATPRGLPVDATLGFHREEHGTVASGDPWSVFQRDREWREQPLIAEGSVRAVELRAALDTRDRRREPGGGWFVEGTLRRGLGGSLAMPEAFMAAPADPGAINPIPAPAPPIDARFTTGLLDVRRYHTVGRNARFNLRGLVGGALSDGVLPPQYQHALGGAGSLPGHPRFAADCGSHQARVMTPGEAPRPMLRPYYGCDRFAVFQAEYRGALNLRTGFGPPDRDDERVRHRSSHRPSWVVFFNAGRGWSSGDWGTFARADTPALYDGGLGVVLGEGGVYWAVPLGEHGNGSRFFVRLDRRF